MKNVITHNFGGFITKKSFVDQLGGIYNTTTQTQDRVHSLYTKMSMNDRGEELDQLILHDHTLNDKQKILYFLATIKERVFSEDIFSIEGLMALFLMEKEGLVSEEYNQLLKVASNYYNGDAAMLEKDISKYHLSDLCNNFIIYEVKNKILGTKVHQGGKKIG